MIIALIVINRRESSTYYICSNDKTINCLDSDNNEVILTRGLEVKTNNSIKTIDNKDYIEVKYGDYTYYVLKDNLTNNKDDICKESVLYASEDTTTYLDSDLVNIKGLVRKGEELNVIGHSELLSDGSVLIYETDKGFIYSKYLTINKEDADKSNVPTSINNPDNDDYGGGSKGSLNYLYFDKPVFENNIMPDNIKAIYINAYALRNIDEYIKLAKEVGINAFVVDIKDNNVISYQSDVAKNWSNSTYEASIYTKDEYRNYINKIKDAGIYVIGRMTVFKDSLFAQDHPDKTIVDNVSWMPYKLGGSYWPNPFDRRVWEYNVKYALEAVNEFGFNEIQFDYVRFPEQVTYRAYKDTVAYYNEYNETRAQAIQRFLMYASDSLHLKNVYVSCDVFGEVNNDYVTGYGQYFPAISNVVDVISPMPYPDHFAEYTYGIRYPWEKPYDLISKWGEKLLKRNDETPSKAKIRCYIQGYNATKYPYTIYDSTKIKEQIDGLKVNGLNDYIIWNASSSIDKYNSYGDAINK